MAKAEKAKTLSPAEFAQLEPAVIGDIVARETGVIAPPREQVASVEAKTKPKRPGDKDGDGFADGEESAEFGPEGDDGVAPIKPISDEQLFTRAGAIAWTIVTPVFLLAASVVTTMTAPLSFPFILFVTALGAGTAYPFIAVINSLILKLRNRSKSKKAKVTPKPAQENGGLLPRFLRRK